MRAGAFGLSLLSDPLDVQILQSLEDGALPLSDLRRAAGSPPPTTLRKHLQTLTSLGILARLRQREFPSAVSYELGVSGQDLLDTAAVLASWLAASPDAPLVLGSAAAKGTIKALVDAWKTKMLRALAAKPLSLTELDRLISGVNYPALERRLGAMRLAGLVVANRGHSGSRPYKITRWLGEAVRPLVAAAGWEHRHMPERCEPLDRLDFETIFFLVAPLLGLPSTLDGSCRLAVDLSSGGQKADAEAVVKLEQGRLVSCLCGRRVDVAGSASGSGIAWLNTLNGGEGNNIEFKGDEDLAGPVVASLRRVLQPQGDCWPVA